MDSRDATMNRCSDRGASGSDFQTSTPERYFGDGRPFGPDPCRMIGSGDPSSSRKMIASVGRGSDCAPMTCRGFGNNRRSDRKACRGVGHGICDCDRVWDREKKNQLKCNHQQ